MDLWRCAPPLPAASPPRGGRKGKGAASAPQRGEKREGCGVCAPEGGENWGGAASAPREKRDRAASVFAGGMSWGDGGGVRGPPAVRAPPLCLRHLPPEGGEKGKVRHLPLEGEKRERCGSSLQRGRKGRGAVSAPGGGRKGKGATSPPRGGRKFRVRRLHPAGDGKGGVRRLPEGDGDRAAHAPARGRSWGDGGGVRGPPAVRTAPLCLRHLPPEGGEKGRVRHLPLERGENWGCAVSAPKGEVRRAGVG